MNSDIVLLKKKKKKNSDIVDYVSPSLLKSNRTNSILKDVLRDKGYSWFINCTTQEYLFNVGLDSYFTIPPHVWRINQIRGP